ncbi:DegV family protein [Desulfuribacillus alkaliarsenatis]|uniref:EDD domain protein n=1 Tax=Desulfuribacillus alkaliarsenatis TaxID=766136 RepID=A0A1E5G621_9FIRM|nr:DegV family protein [Desulfuribacillus alkaliarsenatis]OEF98545.1 EDD domain protein [Desulfuribacillus alkaliarsenatis]
MGIKIVVDSTCDLQDDVLQEYGIERVSLKVHFKNETYRDWIDIKPKEFYQKLRNSEVLPTTSQPSPAEFIDLYKSIATEDDSIISIHLGAKLSGTVQSAVLAKSMLENYDITVVDSKQATCGTGFIAIAAAEAAKHGKSKEDILALIEKIIDNQRTLFMVDTLEYLKKGGRIGKASALIGSLLNIKPILSLDIDGGVMSVDKARGKKKAEKAILQILKNTYGDKELSVALCHADSIDTVEEFSSILKEELNIADIMIADIGPVIGTHVGPGAWGVIAHEKNLKS